jgi:membrane protease YdiL (CAAX protease family)
VEDSSGALSLDSPQIPGPDSQPVSFDTVRPTPLDRLIVLGQAIMVSGIPTQIFIFVIIWAGAGIQPLNEGRLNLEFFAMVSLIDTALIALLIRMFLTYTGENSNQVFLGSRPVRGEVLRGLALVPITFAGVVGIVLAIRTFAPWLHNVERSPLEDLMRTPLEAGIFLVVVILAGGVREELQRAFILHRFKHYLGGVKLGLLIFSVMFGVLHYDQGWDVSIAIGLLGLLWGILYIRRRSAMMGMVNHACFNAAQVVQVMVARYIGLPT